jgi:predicted small integral membrane protein
VSHCRYIFPTKPIFIVTLIQVVPFRRVLNVANPFLSLPWRTQYFVHSCLCIFLSNSKILSILKIYWFIRKYSTKIGNVFISIISLKMVLRIKLRPTARSFDERRCIWERSKHLGIDLWYDGYVIPGGVCFHHWATPCLRWNRLN